MDEEPEVFSSSPSRPTVFLHRLVCGWGAFVPGWLIFYNAPPWLFTAAYLTFGMLVLFSLWLVPVRWPASLIQMRQ